MKKIILFTLLLASSFLHAQLEIAPYNFQNGDTLEGWTILDHDNTNGGTWALQTNYASNLGSEPITVLGLSQLVGPGTASEWAILPVQDMSFYSGAHVKITYLKGLFELMSDAELKLYAFVSEEIPTAENFLSGEPVATYALTGGEDDPIVHVELTADIPAIYNVPNVHFAIAYQWAEGQPAPSLFLELTKVVVTADQLADLDNAVINRTVIKQNPVAEKLDLELSNTLNAGKVSLQIYNINGALVKDTNYTENGIDVNNLSAGMYLLVLNYGNTTEKLKFIKK